jgi:UDP-N-acetylglucosamine 2-epimerase (non-hydrolysing)
MIGAIAAAYQKIPVGHVEAGLRTDTLYNPFPEEINRRLVSVVTHFHFAPTKRSANALLRENVSPVNIIETGNTVIDAIRITLKKLQNSAGIQPAFVIPGSRRILVTTHRRESFGEPLHNILLAIRQILERNPNVEMVFPVHLNPNVRRPAFEQLAGHERICLTEPFSYERFIHAMFQSDLILTDSGGVQEEAPFLGKPVLVMRENTERPEAVDAGTALLVGTDPGVITAETERLLNDRRHYQRMARVGSPFGDGYAAKRIADHIEKAIAR